MRSLGPLFVSVLVATVRSPTGQGFAAGNSGLRREKSAVALPLDGVDL